MSNSSDWCFISGLVSAQSERLMDSHSVLGLLDAATTEDISARLRASLLFADTPPTDTPTDDVHLRFTEIVRDLAASAPDDRIADLFLQEHEWLAFRQYLKAALTGKTEANAELFKALWNGNVPAEQYQPMADAARPLRELTGEAGEDIPGLVDRVLDAHEAGALRQTAHAIGGEALPGWVDLLTDLRAALAIFRATQLGWNTEKSLAPWLAAGFDNFFIFDLAAAKQEDWPVIWERMGLSIAADILNSEDAPAQIERAIDARITAFGDDARGMPFGPEVVFAFLWALKNEALNLRIVLTARACGMDEARVAAQLRN